MKYRLADVADDEGAAPRCCMDSCEEMVCWHRIRQRDGVAGEFLCSRHFTLLVADCPKEAKCYAPLDAS